MGQGHAYPGAYAQSRVASIPAPTRWRCWAPRRRQPPAALPYLGREGEPRQAGRGAPAARRSRSPPSTRTTARSRSMSGLAAARELEVRGKPPEHASHPSMYPPVKYPEHRWGMTVDLDRCTGCSAVRGRLRGGEQCPRGGQGAGRVRARSALAAPRALGGGAGGHGRRTSSSPCSASTAACAPCEPGVPGLRGVPHARGAQRAGLQPLRGHALLRQQLPVSRAPLQLVQLPVALAAGSPAQPRRRPSASSGSWRSAPCASSASSTGKDHARDAGRPGEGRRDPDRLPADLPRPRPSPSANLKDDRVRRCPSSRAPPRGYHVLEELGTRPAVTYLKKVVRGTAGGRGRTHAHASAPGQTARADLGGRQPGRHPHASACPAIPTSRGCTIIALILAGGVGRLDLLRSTSAWARRASAPRRCGRCTSPPSCSGSASGTRGR